MIFAIQATTRTKEAEAKDIRAEGKIPAVLYGPEIEPVSITLPYNEFVKLHEGAGASTLIDFSVEGQAESTKVLIQDMQYDPVKGTILHVDFRQIKMGEKMFVSVPIHFGGESMAIKALGGSLVTAVDTVDVACLPKNLISHIDVDISTIATFEDIIKVKNLPVSEGVEILTDGEMVVAKVTAPLSEDQIKAQEEKELEGQGQSVDDVEVEEKGKKEEAEDSTEAKEEKKA